MLPNDFPPHDTVFYYFNKWKLDGTIEQITDMIHGTIRKLAGKIESPSVGIIDFRSVKSSPHVDIDRGIAMNYEFYSDTAVTMVQIAFCKLMLNKIIDTN